MLSKICFYYIRKTELRIAFLYFELKSFENSDEISILQKEKFSP